MDFHFKNLSKLSVWMLSRFSKKLRLKEMHQLLFVSQNLIKNANAMRFGFAILIRKNLNKEAVQRQFDKEMKRVPSLYPSTNLNSFSY